MPSWECQAAFLLSVQGEATENTVLWANGEVTITQIYYPREETGNETNYLLIQQHSKWLTNGFTITSLPKVVIELKEKSAVKKWAKLFRNMAEFGEGRVAAN